MPDARKASYQAAHRESHAIFVQPLSIKQQEQLDTEGSDESGAF
jgi:hypothetical protein